MAHEEQALSNAISDNPQVMYIMAAVDVDVREAKRVAKAKAVAAAAMANSGSLRAIGGPGSRWRGGGGKGVHVHEQLVCSIKVHQNGTLEVAPGTLRDSDRNKYLVM